MKSDIDIAHEVKLIEIAEVAEKIGIKEDNLVSFGRYMAKVTTPVASKSKLKKSKLILVTAITPTKAGIGKTTVSIGLSLGLNYIGKKASVALREPSLGPCFGMKGGAAGGGYAQVLPMENINLHFTGDFHAITSANNMIAALFDNYRYQHQNEADGIKQVLWRRVLDVNDRSLRNIITGLGAFTDGVPSETGFDITAASEIMAILCLAENEEDLKRRVEKILLGFTFSGKPFTVKDLGVAGSIVVLLKDAMHPNLVQTTEGTPAFIHGGPFANIAHGCNSVTATRLALKLGDYCITEAGFGADLGAEKFLDIKCRCAGLKPSCVVIVATIRALKYNGGVPKTELSKENTAALKNGIVNLETHIENMRKYGLPVVVAINRFATDTEAEIETIEAFCKEKDVPVSLTEVFARGGEGGKELAEKVVKTIETKEAHFKPIYDEKLSIKEKLNVLAKEIYRAGDVVFTSNAEKAISEIEKLGKDKLPICVAKTQYSLSDDPQKLGSPKGFTLTVRDVRLSAGAGFIVALTGDIMTMPGLPKQPAAYKIDVDDDGNVSGLF